MSSDGRIERARLRQRIAAEVIDLCERIVGPPRRAGGDERAAVALELHNAHARHSRQLGHEERALRAEERYDRELNRRLGGGDS